MSGLVESAELGLKDFGLESFGSIRTKTALEISASDWSIGCETLDRDYVDFTQTGSHLLELGAKSVRLQAGWAKCEPRPGMDYEWGWLDAVIDQCIKQGVRPWLQTSYGNPAYPGGGGVGLAEGIPHSNEALAGWDRWVFALVTRYSDRVDTWEIWNEPDSRDLLAPEDYATFFSRTARVIRSVQPSAKIIGGAVASHGEGNYAGRFLAALSTRAETHLLDELSFHFYPHNPDDRFDEVDDLRRLCQRFAPHVTLRQGETGAPSQSIPFLAMGSFEWTERKQAAWNQRRMLAHHARGIPFNLFQLADMYYEKRHGARFTGHNSKGLLSIRDDKTVAYRKPSYAAAQHIFSIWDSRFPLTQLTPLAVDSKQSIEAYIWRTSDEAPLLAWWSNDGPPSLVEPNISSVRLSLPDFDQPVLIDLLSGVVYSFSSSSSISDLPCLDRPLALTELDLIAVTKE